jgi:hypothetical protein
MSADSSVAFDTLKSVFAAHEKTLSVKADTAIEYTLLTKPTDVFRLPAAAQAQVSFHLMPLYMTPN